MSSGSSNTRKLRPRTQSATRPQISQQQKKKSNKRNRSISNPSSPETVQSSKIPAIDMPNTDKPITLGDIQSLFSSYNDSLKSFIASEIKSHCDALSDKLTEQIAKIDTRVNQIEKHVNDEIISINEKVDSCLQQQEQSEDDILRITKLNELKITGIGAEAENDLQLIFDSISKLIEFDSSNVLNKPSFNRIYKRGKEANAQAVPLNTVLIKFVAKHIRDEFYSKYLKKIAKNQPIMSNSVGIAGDDTIIRISENLTVLNSKLFMAAMVEKRAEKIAQVTTHDGIVYVKGDASTKKGSAIRSKRDLEILVAQQTTLKASQQTTTDTNKTNQTANQQQNQQQQQTPMDITVENEAHK